ncbi:MAG: NirA family protein [Phycisphaeraceae bacterium]|nr:NirA family protein [Phycisphaeraceae bacterium]
MACGGKSSLDGVPLEGFSDQQRDYLQQLIEQLDLAAVYKAPEAAPSGAPLTVFGTPLEDLSKEEHLKLEEHPWELFPKLERHAAEDRMPEGGDVFMFKHHGLFNVAPAMPGFMCRLRIPGCKMRGDQMIGLAEIAERLAGGYAHVTTRGNLQLREIPPKHILDLVTGLYDLGLTSKGSGADSVRNITCNPTAGFDPQEIIDLSPQAIQLHQHILHTPSLHGIPRKFNVAFDGGGRVSAVADTNDIGFVATRATIDGEERVLCKILLGGITGHLDFARDSGFACTPEQTVDVTVAMIRVFIEHGDRTNRKKARLKYLLDDWGLEKFTRQAEKRLGFDLIRTDGVAMQPRPDIDRQGHIGVHPQGDGDQYYAGIALPMGRLNPEQMRELGGIAQAYGSNDIRLTVWQNLIIPGIRPADLDDAIAKIRAVGLDVSASSFASGVVACTGRFGCKFASAHTKEHGSDLVAYLQERVTLDQPINIHLTGCSHSCAQHYIGDIGLLGASTEDGREAYQVYLGGGSDHNQGIARHLCGPVAAEQLPGFIESIVQIYLDQRETNESFLSFTRRHDEQALQTLFLDAPVEAKPNLAEVV